MKLENIGRRKVCLSFLLIISFTLFMLVSIVPISDLIGDGGVSLFSEAYAKGSGGDHSGGGGGKHLGHQKGSGKHDDGQHSGVTGGHSIEDKVFRQ
jgi:hypothetical protein